MHLRPVLEEYCLPCLRQYDLVVAKLEEFRPGDWTDWAQLITSAIGILWVLYQFNRLRRSAEKELEDYLERHLEQKLRDFQKERAQTLPIFDHAEQASHLQRLIDRVFANCTRLLFSASRWIPLVPSASELQYAIVTLQSGNSDGARRRFESFGNELLDLANKYQRQAKIKRLEAANVFLYSGSVAASSIDHSNSIAAFKKALDVNNDDLDAHERIGREYLRIGSLQDALAEFAAMRELAAEDPIRKARAYRLTASVYKILSRPGLALRELQQALDMENSGSDSAKIGETLEMFGDLYRNRPPRYQNTALSYYERAIQSCKIASDYAAVLSLERTVWNLTHDQKYVETLASRLLNRLAEGLKAIALKLRVPDHMP